MAEESSKNDLFQSKGDDLDLEEDHEEHDIVQEDEARRALPIEEREKAWVRDTYKGDDLPQLSFRAVATGFCLGALLHCANLYVGLKNGGVIGISITAAVMSWALYRVLAIIAPRFFSDISILENNCMQTLCSAGCTALLVSSVPAYALASGENMLWWQVLPLILLIGWLGIAFSIPTKRMLINQEMLRFPSGTAAGSTLATLHNTKSPKAKKSAIGLFSGLGFSAVFTWLRDSGAPRTFLEPYGWSFPGELAGYPPSAFSVSLVISPLFYATGIIQGFKVSWSILLGGTLCWVVVAPYLYENCMIIAKGYPCPGYDDPTVPRKPPTSGNIRNDFGIWVGVATLLSAAFTDMAFNYKSIAMGLKDSVRVVKFAMVEVRKNETVSGFRARVKAFFIPPRQDPNNPTIADVEPPITWALLGAVVFGTGVILWEQFALDIYWVYTLIAVFLTYFMVIIACRSRGETDYTPTGATAKIPQLVIGALDPENATSNIMAGAVTAGAADVSTDLLTDLKTGYLLGANVRKQVVAQHLGMISSVILAVPLYYVLIPDVSAIGSEQWPVPAAYSWYSISLVMQEGFSSLYLASRIGMLVGAITGVVVSIAGRLAPPKVRMFIPSATSLGVGCINNWSYSFAYFIGATGNEIARIIDPQFVDDYSIAIASGLMAGEAMMGALIAVLAVAGVIPGPDG